MLMLEKDTADLSCEGEEWEGGSGGGGEEGRGGGGELGREQDRPVGVDAEQWVCQYPPSYISILVNRPRYFYT